MIGVDQYKNIRHLYAVEGQSIRTIAKTLGISRNTVKRYCLGEIMPWEKRPKVERQKKVITEDVKEFVRQCFELDKTAPGKQHHTSKHIYDRLVALKDFQGAESTVRRQQKRRIRKLVQILFGRYDVSAIYAGDIADCLECSLEMVEEELGLLYEEGILDRKLIEQNVTITSFPHPSGASPISTHTMMQDPYRMMREYPNAYQAIERTRKAIEDCISAQ